MIEVRQLTKKFDSFVAVDDVSFQVGSGEILALVGPNGSGKSTTMKCIAGLTAPTKGEIVVNRNPVGAGRRDWLSYLPQKVVFPENLTGTEVVRFYSRLRNLPSASIERAFDLAHLNGFRGRAVREYSAGMLQRLGIAIALMPEAPIVMLDEPTAGLDADAVSRLRELMAAMRDRGQTVIVSTHVLSEVEMLADRVAILVRGKLAAFEPVREFRERMAQQARMRIQLQKPDSRWCETARSAGALSATLDGIELIVTATAENYLPILKTLESGGAQVQHFFTEEPTLESLYLRCIRETTGDHCGN